jgi:hypothetical protein
MNEASVCAATRKCGKKLAQHLLIFNVPHLALVERYEELGENKFYEWSKCQRVVKFCIK